jgi:hypothetical protein
MMYINLLVVEVLVWLKVVLLMLLLLVVVDRAVLHAALVEALGEC